MLNRVLSTALIVAICLVLGLLVYTIAKSGEKFTEFYVLGLEGKATGYPAVLRTGEEGRVIVGIINQERETGSYHIEVRIAGIRNNEIGPLELAHGEKWEEIVSFTPHVAGDRQKVEFLLYWNNDNEPYRKLYLWVDVRG